MEYVELMRASRESIYLCQDIDKGEDSLRENSLSFLFEAVAPLTEFASCWYGKGTGWAACQKDGFDLRYALGPIIIMSMKNSELSDGALLSDDWDEGRSRSLLWVQRSVPEMPPVEITFLNEDGTPVSPLEEGDPRIPILQWAFEQNPMAIRYFAHPSPEMYKDAIIRLEGFHDSLTLVNLNIPEEYFTDEFCLDVLKDGGALFYLPREKRAKFYHEAVEFNGRNLQFIPEDDRTEELCLKAVKQDATAVLWVPYLSTQNNLLQKALGFIGFAGLKKCVGFFHDRYVEKIRDEALKTSSLVFSRIPKRFWTDEAILRAIDADGLALRYLENRSRDVCEKAVRKNGLALKFVDVPSEVDGWYMGLCWDAVRGNSGALQYVPMAYRTREICWEAVRKDWKSLRWVPDIFHDGNPMPVRDFLLRLYREAASQSHHALQIIPVEVREMVQDALPVPEQETLLENLRQRLMNR